MQTWIEYLSGETWNPLKLRYLSTTFGLWVEDEKVGGWDRDIRGFDKVPYLSVGKVSKLEIRIYMFLWPCSNDFERLALLIVALQIKC